MELDHLPASMIVLGGGYVAMEQAQLFARLGTRVTMLVRSQLARREEPEIAAGIRAERDSGRLCGVHLLADGAGDAILAGVYAIEAQRTVTDLAAAWNPYLTIGEAMT